MSINLRPSRLTLARARFQRWLGQDYDLGALDAVLATAAAEQLYGDPVWLLLVSGSGNAKTETVQALVGAGALITSTIQSEGAFLSGTPPKETATDATGGLLRVLGTHGVLVIKDVSSILSMDRHMRGMVLAALREIHDGRWQRNVGSGGGRTLTWEGRLAVVGAVTTAWDQAHDVMASLGDRFVVLRMDSTRGRVSAGRCAIGNTGSEIQMRAELADAVRRVLETIAPGVTVTSTETHRILAAANVVALARTGVEYNYRGDVVDAHAPEMPTRLAKQLTQLLRGAVAMGMDRQDALGLAIRCARDSMPPLRLAILTDVAAHPGTPMGDLQHRLDKPYTTVSRQVQALHVLGLLTSHDCQHAGASRKPFIGWSYRLADGIVPDVLDIPLPEM